MTDASNAATNRMTPLAMIAALQGWLWPFFALVALVCFAAPVHDILSGLSQNLRSAQSIDLGYVKVTVREAKIAPPEPDVGKALAQLDRELLGVLLEHSTDSGYFVCLDPKEPWDQERKRKYDRLVRIGLVDYRSDEEHTQEDCPGLMQIAWLSTIGKATRAYFQRLVLEQITIGN